MRRRVLRLTTAAVLIAAVCTILPHSGRGRQVPAGSTARAEIDDGTKAAIIDSISMALDRIYVFPDVAEKIGKMLRKNMRSKKYDEIASLAAFTERLTGDMREVSRDKHLWVRPASNEEIRESRIERPTDEEIQRRIDQQARQNFGFEKVERFPWNIGYLKFDNFADATYAGKTATAAMNFLAHCDAIIIDLRENGGGSPSMVQLITSYFLDEPTHLNSFYVRKTDSMKDFWSYAYVEGERMSDVPLYILTSRYTFSAAEEFTYNLKNLERATIIGETTGGGAHPTERLVFAEQRVVMSCPFGRAINPVTGTNWEGNGIDPHIAVPQEEALDAARIEALKDLRERLDDERLERALEFAVKRFEALRRPVEIDLESVEKYAGDYGPRHIVVEDGALHYVRDGRPKYRMIPITETLFCFAEVEYFMIEVELDEGGDPVAIIGVYDNGLTDRSPRE